MRLWTLHPKYLDSKGLVALSREGLLAQKVLRGQTRGYRQHPQLIRFQQTPDPQAAIAAYLAAVLQEATCRGYVFDASKIEPDRSIAPLEETVGQVLYEWSHLCRKLEHRSPDWHARWRSTELPKLHPLFHLVPGDVRDWERR